MYYFSGIEQQQINVAPSSESFTNWRAILSPTWPSKELESSSVGDISMRQALENANLLQIIKSTLAGTRTRTMDQARFLPSLYQGSGNSASQEPSEVSAESAMRSQDADEMTIVSGLPQIGVFSALSTSSSVTHQTTTVSSQIMPYAKSSISKEITPGSDIISTSPSSSPLPLINESPHVIVSSKLTVPPAEVPLATDTKQSFSTNTSNPSFNKSSGTPLSTVTTGNSSTTKYALSRNDGQEFSVVTSFNNKFGLVNGHSTLPAERKMNPRNRKVHLPALHAFISNNTSVLLPTQRVPLDSNKSNSFSGIIHKESSLVLMKQPPESMTPHKKSSIYVTASAPGLKSKTLIPWISTSAFHTSGIPSAFLKMITDLPSASPSSSTKERALLSDFESPKPLHLVTDMSSPAVPTVSIPEAISTSNALAQAPASTNIPVSYSADEVTSLTVRLNKNFDRIADATVSAPSDKSSSKIHLTNSHVTEPTNWVSTKDNSDIAYESIPSLHYEPALLLPDYSLMRSLQRRVVMKDSTATVFTNVDASSVLPSQSPWSQTTNFTLELPVSKQTPWRIMLDKMLSLERTSSAAFSVSLPTSHKGLLQPHSTATFISSSNNSRNLWLTDFSEQSPSLSLTEEKGGNTKASSAVTQQAELLSYLTLNKSDTELHGNFHMPDPSDRTTTATLDLHVLPSFAPAAGRLESQRPASLGTSNAVSKGIIDTSNTGKIFKTTALVSEWVRDLQPSAVLSVSSGKQPALMSQAAKHYADSTTLRMVPGLQQQTNYVHNQTPSSSASSSVDISVTSIQNVSTSAFSGMKSRSLTEFSPESHTMSKDFTPALTKASIGMDSFPPTSSTYSHSWPFTSYAKSETMLKSQTTNSEDLPASTNSLNAASPTLSLASQFIARLSVPVKPEISAVSGKKTTVSSIVVHELLSSTPMLNIVEEHTTSGKTKQFSNNPDSGTKSNEQPTTLSTEGWYTKGGSDILDTVKVPNSTKITPLPTNTTNAAIITSVHASQTQLTSLLPTTNFTHSVITVLPSVSPGVIPSVATSEATPVTGKSAPTSPMLTSSLFSLSTENSPSVMALSTLISTLAKNHTAPKMASTLSPIVTRTAFPVVSRDESTTTVHTTSSFPVPKSSTVSAPTTHATGQSETTLLDTKKSTSPDITKTSTAYPLTITAALTSITASAKTTRLLPTPAENTSSATPVSTAAFANATTVLPLECQLSRNLFIKTVLFLNTRRLVPSDSLKQNVTKGLTQALRQAFNQNVNAQ
ncbi:Glutathione hydrolase proenzyme, partial [Varanus komodoensis]